MEDTLEEFEKFENQNKNQINFSPNKISCSDIKIEEVDKNLSNNFLNETKENSNTLIPNRNSISNNIINIPIISNNEENRSIDSPALRYSIEIQNANSKIKNTNPDRLKDKGGILYETVCERKIYEEKVQILQIRLKKLRDQEIEINRKISLERKKIHKVKKIRGTVVESKKKYLQEKDLRKKEVENLKKELLVEKEKRKEKLCEAKNSTKKEKEKNFSLVKKDRIIISSLVENFKKRTEDMKSYNYYKNKHDEILTKNQRIKRYKEKEDDLKEKYNLKIEKEKAKKENLKKTLEELEGLEVETMKKLEKTIIRNKIEFDSLEKNEGVNFTTLNLKIKHDILQRCDTQVGFNSTNKKNKFENINRCVSSDQGNKNNNFYISAKKNFKNSSRKKFSFKDNIEMGNQNYYTNSNFHKINVSYSTNTNNNNIPRRISLKKSEKKNIENNKVSFTNENSSKNPDYRKTNSVTILDRKQKYNLVGSENNVQAQYKSFVIEAKKNKQNSIVNDKTRKNSSVGSCNNQKNDVYQKQDPNKISIKSVNISNSGNYKDYLINEIVKKID